MAEQRKRLPEEFSSVKSPVWCPGCGDAGVLSAVKKCLADLDQDIARLVSVTGIGCSSKIGEYYKCYGIHWLHGRSLPVAMGIHSANPKLLVLDMGGDGDGYAIGMEHFIHACRRNPDITYVVMNNMVYGLTKGQASPTSHQGLVTTTTPLGARERSVDAVELAIAAGATFAARGFSYNQKELLELLKAAIAHRGFSFMEVLSPCVQYHREPDYEQVREWFVGHSKDIVCAWNEMKDLARDVRAVAEDYDSRDAKKAMALIHEMNEQGMIPTGLIYMKDGVPTFEENHEVDETYPPVETDISLEANRKAYEALQASYA